MTASTAVTSTVALEAADGPLATLMSWPDARPRGPGTGWDGIVTTTARANGLPDVSTHDRCSPGPATRQ